ncbi:hypothetical protein SNE40_002700 [Patella caerulea]|uniref:Myb-like domain-containing protein n=1 Tax=Patella caerulea TaxID=87958 RepID=A0AAN8Q3U4_PATCE
MANTEQDEDMNSLEKGENIQLQLTDADGTTYSSIVSQDEMDKIQNDPAYRTNFLSALKETNSGQKPKEPYKIKENTLPKMWTKEETDVLVKLRIEKEPAFLTRKVHFEVWAEIAEEMRNDGWEVTTNQAINKWKSLKRSYIAMASQDGLSSRPFDYFQEFHEMYADTTRVKLAKINQFCKSALKKYINTSASNKSFEKSPEKSLVIAQMESLQTNNDDTLLSDENNSDSEDSCNCIHSCKRGSRKRLNDSEPITDFIKEFVELQREQIFQHQEFLQKQDEQLSRFERFLNSMPHKKRKI